MSARPIEILPRDVWNERLVESVHPADWTNPAPAARYDLVALGAGTAGLVSAIVAAGVGARVALVERHLMGGDCLNVGCRARCQRGASRSRRAQRRSSVWRGRPIEVDWRR
jgi:pyruvate/2-oxoglutarate dehydrogenase complex dihydrolipoamide dehydrogenase (E3) component